MTPTHGKPDLEAELAVLKDFQRETVDHVHERLWHPNDPTRRFLVADEVGLGKTLVARGVIAKTIDHLWETVDRIDVIYICSNTQIARQNLPKLRIGGDVERHEADRLTMLATQLHHLEGRKLNFVSFTPGTSFNLASSGGKARERVLLFHLLRAAWGAGTVRQNGAWMRFFEGGATKSFARRVRDFDPAQIDEQLSRDFAASLSSVPGPGGAPLADELHECVEGFRGPAKVGWPLSHRRYQLIGAMRQALARASVARLEPDLIILDEFQRFKNLMSDEDEGSDLARELFNHGDARLLLLSATPFKMYTLPDDPEGDDHYRDFIDTVRFLADDHRAGVVKQNLADLRRGLYAKDLERARQARDAAQAELRRVMCRTERLATTPNREGFVEEKTFDDTRLSPGDIHDFRRLAAVSKVVGGQDPLEFWRSAPYVLELMEKYKIKEKLAGHAPDDPALLSALNGGTAATLTWNEIQRYQQIDPANAKMRGLAADVLDRGAWQLAWIPPSLPYYELGGPYADQELRNFTKRLVFSSWAVAPKAISTVVSYEAERRISEQARRSSTSSGYSQYDATRPTGLLAFNRGQDGRNTGMPTLGMLYPSVALAEAGDPLDVARRIGASLPLDWATLEAEVRGRIRGLLDQLPQGAAGGPEDDHWYWAAGALFDRQQDLDLMGELSYGFAYEEHDDHRRFTDHLREASSMAPERLGRRPEDLEEVLVRLAIAGPGNAALRALARVSGGHDEMRSRPAREAASSMAWALRNLFNRPEIMGIVLGSSGGAYWRDVLEHCVHGGLPSVLDEHVYLLDQAISAPDDPTRLSSIAERFDESASLRTAAQSFTDLTVTDGRLQMTPRRTRSHLAVRFGRGVAEDDSSVMREGQVRAAYNSPFWPFVLASTSVGQEGLDFHLYSHAVVHWNLPSNPVDLEQREGRVHRFQGHAVRRNVAAVYGTRAEVASADNPWEALFELAAADREEGMSEIYPSWIPPLEGPARIERYVAALPLSREAHALRRLLRTAGAYRMVLGQPRQSELLRYLGEEAGDLSELAIDLEPKQPLHR